MNLDPKSSLMRGLCAAGCAVLSCLGAFANGMPANVLTADDVKKGWELLFDGKYLTGWHSYDTTIIVGHGWGIDDSALYLRTPGGADILCPKQFTYQDFELSIDWRIPDKGNSGIFIRYLENQGSENTRTGPESQICGQGHPNYVDGLKDTSPGACYNMYAPSQRWMNPAGQYNTFHIVAFRNRIAHYGNRQKLLEYEIGTPDWQSRFALSKYKDSPLYGELHAGKVFLQDHGSPVWFRNMKIRRLDEKKDPWTDPDFVWPDGSVGTRILPVERSARPKPSRYLLMGNGVRYRGENAVWKDVLGRGRLLVCEACPAP